MATMPVSTYGMESENEETQIEYLHHRRAPVIVFIWLYLLL